MSEACAWMRNANATAADFKAGSCPAEETVEGCKREQSDNVCKLSLE
jgi:hypothetical protein